MSKTKTITVTEDEADYLNETLIREKWKEEQDLDDPWNTDREKESIIERINTNEKLRKKLNEKK